MAGRSGTSAPANGTTPPVLASRSRRVMSVFVGVRPTNSVCVGTSISPSARSALTPICHSVVASVLVSS